MLPKRKTFRKKSTLSMSSAPIAKGGAAFSSKLPKLFILLGHDMRLKMVQMGHITSFLTLAHKFVVVFDFKNMP